MNKSGVSAGLTSLGVVLLSLATYLWLFTKPIVHTFTAPSPLLTFNYNSYYAGFALLIAGILASSVGYNFLVNDKPPEKTKTRPALAPLGVAVGAAALLLGLIFLFPLRFLGVYVGVSVMFSWVWMFSIALLTVGAFRLSEFSSSGLPPHAKEIHAGANLLVLAAGVIVLFLEMVGLEHGWPHVLLGAGLSAYAVGRLVTGAFAGKINAAQKALGVMFGLAIGFFSIPVVLFSEVTVFHGGGTTLYLGFGFFSDLALILIGTDFLASAVFGWVPKLVVANVQLATDSDL